MRIGLGTLRSHPLRTILTLLGNTVAMMSVIAVVSVLAGVDAYVRTEIAREGSNTVVVRQFDLFTLFNDLEGFTEAMHNPEITMDDVRYLRDFDLPGVLAVGARGSVSTDLRAGGRTAESITVHGRSAFYPLLDALPLAAGRHVSELEDARGRGVIVLGGELADRLFDARDPIGRTVTMAGGRFRVIGVLAERAATLGNDPNEQAIVPIRALLRRFDAGSIEIPIRAVSVDSLEVLAEATRVAMRVRRGLRPSERETFAVSTAENLVGLWGRISRLLFAGLVGIVSISLVVGGIVIMNMMLVSVTERTREIGLRRALGARRRDLVVQFLSEATVISVLGGAIGIGIGIGIAALAGALSPLPYAVEPWSIVLGLVVTMGTGIAFGTLPALRAARLDPTTALRNE